MLITINTINRCVIFFRTIVFENKLNRDLKYNTLCIMQCIIRDVILSI